MNETVETLTYVWDGKEIEYQPLLESKAKLYNVLYWVFLVNTWAL